MKKKADKNRQLTPTQLEALSLLLSGESITDVAKTLHVKRETIYRWQDIPEFDSALKAEQSARMKDSRRQFSAMMADLMSGMKKALAKLEQILDSGIALDAVKVQAASQLINATFKAREIIEFEERIEALEARASEVKP